MRRSSRWLLAAALLAFVAAPAWAQPPEGGRGRGGRGMGMRGGVQSGAMLLRYKAVQEELHLTDDQRKEATAFNDKMRDAMQDLQDADPQERMKKFQEMRSQGDRAVSRILKPEQVKRLHEIALQVAGARALSDPKVASELSLDDSQKQKIREVGEEQMKKLEEMRTAAGGDREKMREKMADMNRETEQQLREVLTADQRSRWKTMIGEPFKGLDELRNEMRAGGGPGGRRGRGGPGGEAPPPPPDRP